LKGVHLLPEANVTKIIVDVNWISALGTIVQAVAAVAAYYVARSAKQVAEQQKDISDRQREIAEQQTNILQTQVNLTLYERRYNIYQSLMTLIGTALSKGSLTNDDLVQFWRSSKEGGFLLDDELNSYIQEVQKRCNIFATLSKVEPKTDGPENLAWVLKMDNEKAYLLEAFDEIPKRFEKYLGFNQISLK
jgi:hypothetical protein